MLPVFQFREAAARAFFVAIREGAMPLGATQARRQFDHRDSFVVNATGRPVGITDPTGKRDLLPLTADLTPVLGGRLIYVDGRTAAQGGTSSASKDGSSWDEAMSTMARAIAAATTGDVILFKGDIEEQGISTPASVNYVTVIGMQVHQRNARWIHNGNLNSAFVTVRGLGWVFQNIYFAGGTENSCIKFLRDATYNASEGRVLGCVFNGGNTAIENTGCANMHYKGNRFINIRGAGTNVQAGAIVLSQAYALPTNCDVEGNQFYNCQRHIYHAMARSRVVGNEFQAIGHDSTATEVINLDAAGISRTLSIGVRNFVYFNMLGRDAADCTIANGYIGGTNSIWPENFANDAVDTSLPT